MDGDTEMTDFDAGQSTEPETDFQTSGQDEMVLLKQGAEARLFTTTYLGRPAVVKERFTKRYRHPDLDRHLSRERLKAEARNMLRCRQAGIDVPCIYFVDMHRHVLVMEMIAGCTVRDRIECVRLTNSPADTMRLLSPLARRIGAVIAAMHRAKIVHGDLTTSNMLIRTTAAEPETVTEGDIGGDAKLESLVLIDFGLSSTDRQTDDRGVDLYVLERAMLSTHPDTERLFEVVLEEYMAVNEKDGRKAIAKLDEVRLRGRKREMVG